MGGKGSSGSIVGIVIGIIAVVVAAGVVLFLVKRNSKKNAILRKEGYKLYDDGGIEYDEPTYARHDMTADDFANNPNNSFAREFR